MYINRKNSIKEGKQPEIKKIENHSVKELSEKYFQWINGRHLSAVTKAYRINDLVSHFGSIPLRRFNTLIAEQYQRGLKPASVNKNISILKAKFKKAVDWNMGEEETLKYIRRVKNLTENNRRLRYLSKEECQSLITAFNGYLKSIVTFAVNTGCRKGEILNLRCDHVDLKHGFILLNKTKNGDRREIPINNTVRGILQGLTRRLDVPYVFFDSATGKPYRDIKRSYNTATRRAGIRDFHFHDLRHTFASPLVMARVDITTVKELLGHKTLTMTLRYSHLAPSHKVKTVDLLNETLTGSPTVQKLYNPMKKEVAISG